MAANNKKPLKTIAVLVEEGATAGYLVTRLKETFNEKARVITISSADIRYRQILDQTDILFIPGVRRASDAYRNNLGADGGRKIKDWVKKGGTAVGLCQGGYLLTEQFRYANKYTGLTRIIHSPCGIFEGIARGPIDEYTDHNDLKNPFSDHAVAKLDFDNGEKGAACYAHGPYLELFKKADPKEYKIIARFSEVRGNPVAIASRQYGKGKAIFSAVVPEISGMDMAQTDDRLLEESGLMSEYMRAGLRYARKLAAYENERQIVWNRLMKEIMPK